MRKYLLILLIPVASLSFYSCKKSDSTNPGGSGSSTFTANINGTAETFTLQATGTLIRSTADNQKRLDFNGISQDNKYRIILTIGEETSTGNAVTTGDHLVQLFNDDDPNTPQDESIDSDAFITLSTSIGGGSWFTDADSEKGNIHISSDNVSGTSGTISGSFTGTLTSLGGGTNYTITGGTFNNIKYSVLN